MCRYSKDGHWAGVFVPTAKRHLAPIGTSDVPKNPCIWVKRVAQFLYPGDANLTTPADPRVTGKSSAPAQVVSKEEQKPVKSPSG